MLEALFNSAVNIGSHIGNPYGSRVLASCLLVGLQKMISACSGEIQTLS